MYIHILIHAGNLPSGAYTGGAVTGRYDWRDVIMNSDGTKAIAAVSSGYLSGGYLYSSTDSGANWVEITNAGVNYFKSLAGSADLSIVYAAMSWRIMRSIDGGVTWTDNPSMPIGTYVRVC